MIDNINRNFRKYVEIFTYNYIFVQTVINYINYYYKLYNVFYSEKRSFRHHNYLTMLLTQSSRTIPTVFYLGIRLSVI